MKKLTVGMAVYDDFDGVYFTIQALRMYHKEVLNDIEFIIVDNSPNTESGNLTKNFVSSIREPVQYIPFDEYSSTSLRNIIFKNSRTPYTLCIDCHVLLTSGSLKKLIDYYDSNLDKGNLLQGPLVYDDMLHVSTHFNRVWGEYMEGQWATDSRYQNSDSEPFEIEGQGMGLFTCRTDSWLGFNENFRGFGGEEIYIQDKYKAHGKKTICLPFLEWVHRFGRVGGTKYRNDLLDRYRNYLIGYTELNKNTDIVEAVFRNVGLEHHKEIIRSEVKKLFSK